MSGLQKVQSKRTEDGLPVHSFQTLLSDLGTVAKNTVIINGSTMQIITTPTPLQHHALELLKVSLRC